MQWRFRLAATPAAVAGFNSQRPLVCPWGKLQADRLKAVPHLPTDRSLSHSRIDPWFVGVGQTRKVIVHAPIFNERAEVRFRRHKATNSLYRCGLGFCRQSRTCNHSGVRWSCRDHLQGPFLSKTSINHALLKGLYQVVMA
jgi:hypothetical protein